jgi:hypothetical protein
MLFMFGSVGSLHLVGELVYIPIYDRYQLGNGVIALLEILMPTHVSESMLVANVISFVSTTMDSLMVRSTDSSNGANF